MLPRRTLFLLPVAVAFSACATLPGREPPKVDLIGVESLGGEGLELRVAVKLRIQNPDETPIDYDGISLDLELRGHDFASGVSDQRGSVPRFGEAVVTVPMTISASAIVKQALSLASGERGRLEFVARGRLAGGLFGGMRFASSGQFDWPAGR